MAKRQYRGPQKDGRGELPPELAPEVTIDMPRAIDTGHYYEPYPVLVGPIANITPEKKGKRKKGAGAIDDEQAEINRARKRRYDAFMEHLAENGGNQIFALSLTYGVPSEEIRARLHDYKADVALGVSSSSVSDLLEDVGLGKRARIGMLKRHAYSADPKVSLVALKLATDLDGDKHDTGTTYETYIRMIKSVK